MSGPMIREYDEMNRWEHKAAAAIRAHAATGEPFTADDLHANELAGEPLGGLLQAALQAAAAQGIIRKVGVARSTRPERKSGYTGVWAGGKREGEA